MVNNITYRVGIKLHSSSDDVLVNCINLLSLPLPLLLFERLVQLMQLGIINDSACNNRKGSLMKLKTVPTTLAIFTCVTAWSIIVAGENRNGLTNMSNGSLASQHGGLVHKAALHDASKQNTSSIRRADRYDSSYRFTRTKAIPRYNNSTSSHENDTLAATGLSLDIESYKVRGYHTAHLSWQGASSSSVVIYRDGQMIVVTDNDGDFVDDLNSRSRGVVYSYQICELGTNSCSESVLSAF